jgi:hypothetical protein
MLLEWGDKLNAYLEQKMTEFLKGIYSTFGAPYPTVSLIIVTLITAAIGFGTWKYAENLYQNDVGKSSLNNEQNLLKDTNTGIENKRPAMINIRNSKDVSITNNVGIGNMDMINADNVEGLHADKNKLVNPDDAKK